MKTEYEVKIQHGRYVLYKNTYHLVNSTPLHRFLSAEEADAAKCVAEGLCNESQG